MHFYYLSNQIFLLMILYSSNCNYAGGDLNNWILHVLPPALHCCSKILGVLGEVDDNSFQQIDPEPQ